MTEQPQNAPWWKGLNSYHWFVFAMGSLAWLFDTMDQQLFNTARSFAMEALLPDKSKATEYGGYATSVFVVGWACGGLIFGSVGDRIGRAKTLALTVLLYSLCTGLSAFSQNFTQFCVYRFITGLGVGGVFGLAVALVADTMPDRSRGPALGLLQALSAVGNIGAGLITIGVGYLVLASFVFWGFQPWQALFLIGAIPAFLCVFMQFRLKEPTKWLEAKAKSKAEGGKGFGSYSSLFSDPRLRNNALFGMLLCIAGVVGVWGVGFFSPELTNGIIGRILKEQQVPADQMAGNKMIWGGITMCLQQVGGFIGMMTFTKMAIRYGLKPVFVIAFLSAFVATVMVFQFMNSKNDIFWMIPIMGFFQMSVFPGFAMWLPELFPTRLRSTGTSFCYNVGRFIAATGPFTLGYLKKNLNLTALEKLGPGATDAQKAVASLDAFRDAASWLAAIYLVGLIALPFLPNTKDKPLEE